MFQQVSFQIKRVYSTKGKTFCLSVVEGDAYWSVHNGTMTIEQARRNIQRQHNEQILSLWQEKNREEAKLSLSSLKIQDNA
jgi:hypothetical protein